MGENSLIQWTHYTWSPWFGCRKVSPGCKNCYIVRTTPFRTRHIEHGPRRDAPSESYLKQPLSWNAKAEREGVRPRVFPSLCDPFDHEVPWLWFVRFMRLVEATPHLDWLLLTKRIQNVGPMMKRYMEETGRAWTGAMPPNVWLGVSVENQECGDERMPQLFDIGATVRFLSVEPQIDEVNVFRPFKAWLDRRKDIVKVPAFNQVLHWVIYGGESGEDEDIRPFRMEWLRDGLHQCGTWVLQAFVKQMGAMCMTHAPEKDGWPNGTRYDFSASVRVLLKDKKGGDPSEWPQWARVREFPLIHQ